MDSGAINQLVADMWAPVFDMISNCISGILNIIFLSIAAVIILFILTCRINPFKLSPEYLESLKIIFRWYLYDIVNAKNIKKVFKPYGFTMFVGPQGAGKTMSMVHYCWEKKQQYPKCLLVTNFKCSFADHQMTSWRDFLDIRNGEDGVIFAIDEIHSEYSSA